MSKRFFGIAIGLAVLVSPASAQQRTASQIRPANGATFEGYTFVPIPTSNSIEAGLIDTFPRGLMRAWNPLRTPFDIVPTGTTCGPTGAAQCNFYDAFGFNGAGQQISFDVSLSNVSKVYTLMNAYAPQAVELARIEFIGGRGSRATYELIGGQDIRDFYQGFYTNDLHNGVAHVRAVNALNCNDPGNCLGSGGSGNVATGLQGRYVIDEQEYFLPPAFQSQKLVRIVITDTYNGSNPILLGITAGP